MERCFSKTMPRFIDVVSSKGENDSFILNIYLFFPKIRLFAENGQLCFSVTAVV